MIAKFSYGHICLRAENLSIANNCIINGTVHFDNRYILYTT